MDHDEIIKEIEFAVDAVQDGAHFTLFDGLIPTELIISHLSNCQYFHRTKINFPKI